MRDSYWNEKSRLAEVARTTDHNLEVRNSDIKAFEPAFVTCLASVFAAAVEQRPTLSLFLFLAMLYAL